MPKISNNSVDTNKKPLKLRNLEIMYANTPSRNGTYFTSEVINNAVTYWENLVNVDPTNKYVYINHPKDKNTDLKDVAGVMENVRYDETNKIVYSDVSVINTPYGLLIRYLIENNYPIGLSVRGESSRPIRDYADIDGKMINVRRVDNFKLKGVDFVVSPAFLTTQVRDSHVVTESLCKEFKGYLYENYENDQSSYDLDVVIENISNMYSSCKDGKCDVIYSNKFVKQNDVDNELFLNTEITEKTNKNYSNNETGGEPSMTEYNGGIEKDRLALQEATLKANINSLTLSYDSIKESYDKSKSEYDEIQDKVTGAKAELNVWNEQRKEAEDKVRECTDTIEQKTSEFETTKQKLEEERTNIQEALKKDKDVYETFTSMIDSQVFDKYKSLFTRLEKDYDDSTRNTVIENLNKGMDDGTFIAESKVDKDLDKDDIKESKEDESKVEKIEESVNNTIKNDKKLSITELEEIQMEQLEKIVSLVKEHYVGNEEITTENVFNVLEHVMKEKSDLNDKIEKINFDKYKDEKIDNLIKEHNYGSENVEKIFESCTDKASLDITYNALKNVDPIKEDSKVSKDSIDDIKKNDRKGFVGTEEIRESYKGNDFRGKETKGMDDDSFMALLKNV